MITFFSWKIKKPMKIIQTPLTTIQYTLLNGTSPSENCGSQINYRRDSFHLNLFANNLTCMLCRLINHIC